MKLLQYRKGFATNSSSTHSIIIANRLSKVVLTGQPLSKGDEMHTPGEYGWENFTLATHKAKMRYLATLINANLDLPQWMKDPVVQSLTGDYARENDHIDHQSVLDLPMDWQGKGLDETFLRELTEFVSREDVMILGGNDNSDGHPLANCGQRVLAEIPRDRGGEWVCRKSKGEWTLFNRLTGSKITFAFGDKANRERPEAPELIDIKITDFCPFSCSYCYQDSTARGSHTDTNALRQIAAQCEENRVFEVALGGGEPTLHPDFVYILEEFRRCGVVPNFTTRNLSWIRDEEMRPAILESCGAFAVSVNKSEEVHKLGELVRRHQINTERIYIHYVLGSSEDYHFSSILRAVKEEDFTITLLGWKSVGRGVGGPLHDNSKWLDTIKQIHKSGQCPRVGVDTIIVNEFGSEIKKAKIPEWLLYEEEGKFSMYYDAVADKWGPSSFCEENEYVKIPQENEHIIDKVLVQAWNKIKPTKRQVVRK